jgi:aminoglycoside phosphotransferase
VPLAVDAAWRDSRRPEYVAGRPRATGSAVIVPLEDASGEPRWIAKFASSEPGRRALERSTDALSALRGVSELSSWNRLVPEVVGAGNVNDYAFVIETALPGRVPTAADWQADEPKILGSLVAAISGLHDATGRSVVVDDALLTGWVDNRITELAEQADSSDRANGLERLRQDVHHALRGRALSASWIHGDYWLGNALLEDDGRVSGIVDWESAAPDELALHDLVHVVLYTRRAIERVHLGRVIRSALNVPLPGSEDEVLARAGRLAGGIDRRTALALYWLRWVVTNLRRHPDLGSNRTWQRENVDLVLATL